MTLLGLGAAPLLGRLRRRSLGQRAPDTTKVVEYQPGQLIRRHTTCSGLINEYRHAA